MKKALTKAFSLVEVLVTVGIIAIVASIIMNAYKGIQNSAIAVAQQKDQSELNQVMAELRMSGGALGIIASNQSGGISAGAGTVSYAAQQAGELTYVLQQAIAAQQKTQKGTVGGAELSADEVIIPYPYAVGSSAGITALTYTTGPNNVCNSGFVTDNKGYYRIVLDSTGKPSISNTVGAFGFIAVKKTSADYLAFTNKTGINYIAGTANSSAFNSGNRSADLNTAAALGTTSTSMAGAKYAGKQSYVWDEDATTQTGPTTSGGGGTPSGYAMSYTTAFTGSLLGGNSFNLAEYRGATLTSGGVTYNPGTPGTPAKVYIFAYLTKDGKPVTDSSPGTLTFETPTVPDATSNVSFTSPVNLLGSNPAGKPGQLSSLCSGLPASVKTQLETGPVTDSTYGTLLQVQLCSYSKDAFTGVETYNGFSPAQWSNATMAIVVPKIDGAPADTAIQEPVVQVATNSVQLDPLGAPTVPPGGSYNAATHTLDLTGAAPNSTFILPPSGTSATYGANDYTVGGADSSTGISYVGPGGAGTPGAEFEFTTP